MITGASGGIGNAIVNKLSDYGTTIIAVYNHNQPSDQLSKKAFRIQADITQSKDRERLLVLALQQFNKIDVLVNCAGCLEPGEFSDLGVNQIKKMIDINFTSTLILTQEIVKIMRRQKSGHIINIGSLGGIIPMPYSAVYSATKFALRGFTFSVSEELKGTSIKISLITPNSVVTKMLDCEALDDNTAMSFVSKPISPSIVADAVLKVTVHPKVELIIPGSQSLTSRCLSFSPFIFSKLYPLFHKIGQLRKTSYLNRYCNCNLTQGVTK